MGSCICEVGEDHWCVNIIPTLWRCLLTNCSVSKESPTTIALHLDHANFPLCPQQFLYMQLNEEQGPASINNIPPHKLPTINALTTKRSIYHSAVSTFFALSDLSGINGMHHEHIHAFPSWQNGPSCYDTVLVSTNQGIDGMWGLDVCHVCLFFLFTHDDVKYPCVLIDWYGHITDSPDEDTGMWIVKPIPDNSAIIHLNSILWLHSPHPCVWPELCWLLTWTDIQWFIGCFSLLLCKQIC